MRISNEILLASTNRHKLEEFQALFKSYPQIVLVPADAKIRNPDRLQHAEKHETYLENAMAKARLANHASHYPSLADDSGLEVKALDGKPGVRSHRYAIPKAGQSQDQANVALLLSELKNATTRSARFVCHLTLAIEGILIHSTGILEGKIAEDPQGKNGFGYDPIFIPKGSAKSLAEMSDAEKNSLSHRALALHDLMAEAKTRGIVFAKP